LAIRLDSRPGWSFCCLILNIDLPGMSDFYRGTLAIDSFSKVVVHWAAQVDPVALSAKQ
jgi:hypothetical protein